MEINHTKSLASTPPHITNRFKFLINATVSRNNRIFCSIVKQGDIVLQNMAITSLLMTRQIVGINVHPSALLAILLSGQLPGPVTL